MSDRESELFERWLAHQQARRDLIGTLARRVHSGEIVLNEYGQLHLTGLPLVAHEEARAEFAALHAASAVRADGTLDRQRCLDVGHKLLDRHPSLSGPAVTLPPAPSCASATAAERQSDSVGSARTAGPETTTDADGITVAPTQEDAPR